MPLSKLVITVLFFLVEIFILTILGLLLLDNKPANKLNLKSKSLASLGYIKKFTLSILYMIREQNFNFFHSHILLILSASLFAASLIIGNTAVKQSAIPNNRVSLFTLLSALFLVIYEINQRKDIIRKISYLALGFMLMICSFSITTMYVIEFNNLQGNRIIITLIVSVLIILSYYIFSVFYHGLMSIARGNILDFIKSNLNNTKGITDLAARLFSLVISIMTLSSMVLDILTKLHIMP